MIKAYVLLTLLCVFIHFDNVLGFKILMICPTPAKSHHILCKSLTDILAEREHELTFISAYPSKSTKYKEIGIPDLVVQKEKLDFGFQMAEQTKLETIRMINVWTKQIVNIFFDNPDVQKFMNDKSQKFDLVIFEYFMNEFLLGFGEKYNCPSMALSSVSLMSWLATMTGNPLNLATVPNVFTTFSADMNLFERVVNTAVGGLQEIMAFFVINPLQESLYNQYFPVESQKVPYEELKKKISAVLINSHPSAGVARPLLPNAVEIGGYHIDDPAPLPADLQKIMDSSKNGVVFFSMGSNLKSSQMDVNLRTILLDKLSKLKETVLWKFEEDLPNKPANVIIKSWMPQNSILAHPNTKLFISHGGLLSMTESTHFGVPLLMIPIFGDQHHNAKAVSDRGHGVTLAFDNITDTSFEWALKEAVNPKYNIMAKKLQKIFLDRPIKAKDLLVYQVEHVIRTNGGAHLSPPKLSRCSDLLLDVAAVFIIPLLLINIVLIFLCYKCCCSNKKTVKESSKAKSKHTKRE